MKARQSPNWATRFGRQSDDYLTTCESLGHAPEIPCKGSFNVRVGHDLDLAASVAASQRQISLNDLTRQALDAFLHGAR
jgi:predicted HicB family RNase H-like nuclease